jgi:ribulose-5-phosphate 4-epimerase/fuculose-1-phosphate aldolase
MDRIAGDLAERVARACRVLGRLELTHAALGHVSARVPGHERMLIRARGSSELGVRYTGADQVIDVDFDGRLLASNVEGLAVPQEIFIHTEIYKARPDVHSVIHIHPPTPMLFTICCRPLRPLYGAYDPHGARLVLDGIPTYERSILINTPARGVEFARAMRAAKICLMRGHGVTSAAASVEQAALNIIRLNQLADINYRAALLGDVNDIPPEDQAEIRAMKGLSPDPSNGAPPSGGEAATWRFYCELTGS